MKKNSLILFIMCMSCTAYSLKAQTLYKLNSTKENTVKVSGSSNVHDWTMISKTPLCEADFGSISGTDGLPRKISSLNFSVLAKSLKSEHASMDTRTYKTIKADTHPQITFKLSEGTIKVLGKNTFSVKASGTLTIAGVSKSITMQVNGEVNPDNSITCSGQEKIKLTDYSIQPPSFMLGAMKVANDLNINYVLNFKK